MKRVLKYPISKEQYLELLNKQEGKCAICERTQEELGKPLFVDHDHITGEVRGLLCHRCNILLGHAKDEPKILLAAVTYLQKWLMDWVSRRL